MKIIIAAFIIILSISSCKDRNEKDEVENVNSKNLTLSPVVHDSLSQDQLEKIKKIHKTFEEVYKVSLDETIENFKRDQNPDKEIEVWQQMANSYGKFISKNPGMATLKKDEAFKLLLLRSMMNDEEAVKEAKVISLTDKEVRGLLDDLNTKPVPVTIEKK